MAHEPDPSGAVSPSGERHPGEVEFDDQVEGRHWREPAGDLSQTMAWGEVEPGRWVAITRIQTSGAPGRLEITRFDADGRLVDVTVQRPSRPPAQGADAGPTPTPTTDV